MINRKKLFFAGGIGNLIEIFESVVYAFLQPYIAKTFFPPYLRENKLLFFLTLILPFLARPIGALIFGLIGDLQGRKTVLEQSMILSGISCLLIAILPSYSSIGIASFYGIIILRFLFGIAMAGEYNNSFLYLAEHSAPTSRAYILSWASFGTMFGVFLSALMAYTISSLIEINLLPEWSFRIPFLLSVFCLFIGYMSRKHLSETADFFISYPTFEANKTKAIYKTVKSQMYSMKFKTIKIILLAGFGTHITHALFFYGPFHLVKYNPLLSNFNEAVLYIAFAAGITSICVPLIGKISTHIGRTFILLISIPALTALYLIFFLYLTSTDSQVIYITFYGALGIFGAAYFTVAPAEIIALLPDKMRSTSNGLLYSVPALIFGALSFPYFQTQFNESKLCVLIILFIATPLFVFLLCSKNKFFKATHVYQYELEKAKVV